MDANGKSSTSLHFVSLFPLFYHYKAFLQCEVHACTRCRDDFRFEWLNWLLVKLTRVCFILPSPKWSINKVALTWVVCLSRVNYDVWKFRILLISLRHYLSLLCASVKILQPHVGWLMARIVTCWTKHQMWHTYTLDQSKKIWRGTRF